MSARTILEYAASEGGTPVKVTLCTGRLEIEGLDYQIQQIFFVPPDSPTLILGLCSANGGNEGLSMDLEQARALRERLDGVIALLEQREEP